MFGENPVRKQDLAKDGSLIVQQVFGTLQGEGPFAGESAIFVRLWGCNLRCWFCDTDFESIMNVRPLRALLDEIQAESRKVPEATLIVLTGGEPLRQNVVPLIYELTQMELEVQIETAGTIWVDGLEALCGGGKGVTLVCSPKTPKLHPMIQSYCWNYKYIISSRDKLASDGLPYAITQPQDLAKRNPAPLARPENAAATIWVQPCDEYDEKKNRANRILCGALAMKHGYRASIQLHKLLELE